VAVVDQYAMSVSFAHSLPLFLMRGLSTLLGRWRFPGTGGLHGQSGIGGVGYIGLVLRNSTGFGPARPVTGLLSLQSRRVSPIANFEMGNQARRESYRMKFDLSTW
jgi:hypothetical protein